MESNREFFNSEAAKNRNVWKYADAGSERTLRVRNIRANPFATGKFDDVLRNEKWRNATGEEELENEDSVEYENEEAFIEEGFAPEESPKFRQLVRAKKLELKAQYGKAHLKTWTTSERKCLGGFIDKPGDGRGPYWDPNINCTNVNIPHVAWVWGWRKKWREFKQGGGLAQLKMQSKGMVPPIETGSGSGTGSGTGLPKPDVNTDPKLDLPDIKKAGSSMLLNILLLGVGVTAIFKLFK